MGCLKCTPDLKLILGTGGKGMNNVNWHLDGAHQVHVDLRGQNGASLIFGIGGIHNTSNEQKLNTRSSTETE